MNSASLLGEHLIRQHSALREIFEKVIALIEETDDQGNLSVIRKRGKALESAALFVVVGEVKAGKSSFINALLGERICDEAPDPCTSTIQELAYGEERSQVSLGEAWERVLLPKEVLRQITIVDTPGTNSIIKQHQTITENYIPQSDLVIFVFSAKNPHTATAWDFLSLVRKDWLRRVVFVLQQSDTASQRELEVNRERVVQYAHERNVQAPRVFSVSAKRELEGAPDSGFQEFRQFIRDAVESGEVWRMKFEAARDTAARVLSEFLERMSQHEAALADDRSFLERLRARIGSRREKASGMRRLLVDSLCNTCDGLTRGLEQDFMEGLSVGSIMMRSLPFLRDKSFQAWLKELQHRFEKRASEQIEADAQRVSKELAEEVAAMLHEVTLEIENRRQLLPESVDRLGADRADLLERLRARISSLNVADLIGEKGIAGTNLGALTLTGGAMTALGTALAVATKLIVFDFTGGALAAVGISVVAVALLWRRKAIIAGFRRSMENTRTEFRKRLDQEITVMFDKLFHQIEHILGEPSKRVEERIGRIKPLIARARLLSGQLNELEPGNCAPPGSTSLA